MTFRALLLVLPALLAIGCAAEPAAPSDAAAPIESGTSDLTAPSPEKVPVADAKNRDAVVDQARHDRLVGEETTGYLGIVTDTSVMTSATSPSDLAARVANINIQRRAVYTDLAAKDAASLTEVAQTAACELLGTHVAADEAYRAEDGQWKVHTFDLPIELPSFCKKP